MSMQESSPEPSVARPGEQIAADGHAISFHDWRQRPSAGPPLHVHHQDDEAWHVLEGAMRFRLGDEMLDLAAGSTVFVPAGVPHTFSVPGPSEARYLIVMGRRIHDLIRELHALDTTSPEALAEAYRRHASDTLE